MKQLFHDLINIALPFGNVRDGQNGVDPVVSAGIDGLHVEAFEFEYAQDVSVLNDALSETNPVVPHVVRFFVEWKAVERLQIHGVRSS
jgi:hypothetical protein